jgi:hypothetical protein
MTRLIIAAIFLTFILGSCRKNPVSTSTELIGKWKWVLTTGGIAQVHITPEPGSIYILEFRSNNTYRYTKNGTLLNEGVYGVETRMSYLFNRNVEMVIFDNNSTGEIITIEPGKLNLVLDAVEPMGSQYIRYN